MGGSALVTVRPGVVFAPDPAAAFQRANAEVRAELGRDIDVNRTTTAWDVQLAMYNAWNKYVASGYKPSLYPGHSKAVHPSESFHVYDPKTGKGGNALDSDDWTNARVVEILADNGFIRNRLYVKGEDHHFEWIRSSDKHYGSPALAATDGKPFEEDDMYDEKAEERLMSRIDGLTRQLALVAAPYKLYTYGTGIAIRNVQNGASWSVPGQGYVDLLVALGFCQAQSVAVDEPTWNFINQVASVLNPEDPAVDAVLSLSDTDAAKVAAQISEGIQVRLTSEQLDQITAAAAEGGRDAISGLSFVVTAS